MAMYKFKSKATGDVIMLGPNGDHVMRILGREPSPTGIFEAAALPRAAAALEAAVAEDESIRHAAAADDEDTGHADEGVSLRQRVWPLVEMMKRSSAAGEPIVWGV